MSKKITSVHLGGGYHLHVKWNGDKGIDQRGNKWENPDSPVMVNKVVQATISAHFGTLASVCDNINAKKNLTS